MALVLALSTALPAGASAAVVLNLNDSGPDSLRFAVSFAQPGEIISFAQGLSGTIYLTSGAISPPFNSSPITILGPGADVLTIDGAQNGPNPIFKFAQQGSFWATYEIRGLRLTGSVNSPDNQGGCMNAAGTVSLRDMVFENCVAASSYGFSGGGGVFLGGGAGMSVIERCTFINNQSNADGGAVESMGALLIQNSTFWGNSAAGGGGGVAITNGSPATIFHATISNNNSGTGGGGIHIDTTPSAVAVNNSIVSDNHGSSLGPDIYGSGALSLSYSLLGSSPCVYLTVDLIGGNLIGYSGHLMPPAMNGGTTPTCDLTVCSKARDMASIMAFANRAIASK